MIYLKKFVKLRIIKNTGWNYGREARAYRPPGVWFKTKGTNGDDTGAEAGSWSKESSDIKYRWTSVDTSFDNDIPPRFCPLQSFFTDERVW